MTKKDRELIERVQQGDIECFNPLAQTYQSAIYGLAYHWTHNFADAEDITQETLIQAFENLSTLRAPERFPMWLRTIALNICRKRHRRSSNPLISMDSLQHQEVKDQLEDPNHLPDRIIEQQQNVQHILNTLSDKVRLTVTLFYIDNLSHKEIGQFLDIPISTVKSRLHRARHTLKEEALKMVEETLDAQPKPTVTIRKVSGYLHLQEDGDGYLRPTPESETSPTDLFISRKDIWTLPFKQGDFIEARFYAKTPNAVKGSWRFDQINKKPVVLQCSFCERDQNQVGALVTGPGVHICETCVEACVDVLIKENGFRMGFTRSEAAHRTPQNASK